VHGVESALNTNCCGGNWWCTGGRTGLWTAPRTALWTAGGDALVRSTAFGSTYTTSVMTARTGTAYARHPYRRTNRRSRLLLRTGSADEFTVLASHERVT
jgi:hypothetical protein